MVVIGISFAIVGKRVGFVIGKIVGPAEFIYLAFTGKSSMVWVRAQFPI